MLIRKSCKITFINKKHIDDSIASGDKLIFAAWHGRLLLVPFIVPRKSRKKIHCIVSRHGDGEIIASAMGKMGLSFIRGSSNRYGNKKGHKDRGGTYVLRESLKALKNDNWLALTPDGPKGPRMIAKGNILPIAAKTGARIIPISYSSSRSKIFDSWDKFMLPLPFSKIYMIAGEPIAIEKNMDKEKLENTRKELENRLNSLTYEVDNMSGVKKIKPADPNKQK